MLNPEAPQLAADFATPNASSAPELIVSIGSCRAELVQSALEAASTSAAAADIHMQLGQPSDSLWRPELGLAEYAISSGRPGLAAVQFGLATLGASATGEVVADVGTERRSLFLDGWAIPVVSRTTIRASDREIHIGSAAGDVSLTKFGRAYRPTKGARLTDSWQVFPTRDGGPRYIAVSSLRDTASGHPWEQMMGLTPDGDGPDARNGERADIQAGVDLIGQYAPAFAPWMDIVLSGAVLVDPGQGNRANSNSDQSIPGLFSLSAPMGAVQAVDTMVREAARQHLVALMMLDQLTTRVAFHYQPLSRRYKSVGRMLADAHAWGNLIIVHAALSENPSTSRVSRMLLDEYCARFESESLPALDDCSALSETGQALWLRLRGCVHAASWSGA